MSFDVKEATQQIADGALKLWTAYQPQLQQLASHLPQNLSTIDLKTGVGGASAAAILGILTKSEFAGHVLAPGLALVGAQALQSDTVNAVFCACVAAYGPTIAMEVGKKVIVRGIVSIPWLLWSTVTLPYFAVVTCRNKIKDDTIARLEKEVDDLREQLRTAKEEIATANQAKERLEGKLDEASKKRKADKISE